MAQPRTPHRARRRVRIGRVLIVCAAIAAVVGGAVIALRAMTRAAPETPSPQAERAEPETSAVVQPAARPTETVAFEDGCLSAECHARYIDAPNVHTPVAERACDACHAPDTGGHQYPQRDPYWSTCTTCHQIADDRIFQHKAMSADACLACHDPHVGATSALLVADSVGATCVNCHPPSGDAVAHQPYEAGRCESCHEPHGAANSALLIGGDGAEHCRVCHLPTARQTAAGPASHADLQRECLSCHGSHGAEHDALLLAQTRDLCVSCHEEVGATVAAATVSHNAVLEGSQCVSCHEPHDARRPHMLRADKQEVCFSCHDEPLVANDGRTIPSMADAIAESPVVHGAVQHGDCSACHSIHGGTHERLLREVEPVVLAGSDDVRNYALCFNCHDPAMAEVAASTMFRDGDRNLHEVHLRSAGGASSCSACHAVHAGNQPRLIAETVNYQGSGWQAPMGFEVTPDGGRCAPACHEPLAYRRTAGPSSNGGSP